MISSDLPQDLAIMLQRGDMVKLTGVTPISLPCVRLAQTARPTDFLDFSKELV